MNVICIELNCIHWLCASFQLTFNPPVIVASSVESMWLNAHSSHLKPHLTEALWLGCGAAGMKVCAEGGLYFLIRRYAFTCRPVTSTENLC